MREVFPTFKRRAAATGPGAGIGLACGLAIVAEMLGRWVPLVGAPIFAILLGMAFSNLRPLSPAVHTGVRFAAKRVLQAGIILLGFDLNLARLWTTGSHSFGVMIITLTVGLAGGLAIGSRWGVPYRFRALIAVGTAICGASAIAAITPVILADAAEMAYAISTIFFYNIVAVFLFPIVGHMLHLSAFGFGLWAGTAINDVSSVVAAGYSYGPHAGTVATVVKLTRTMMIIPVALGFAFYERSRRQETRSLSRRRQMRWSGLIPWFIVGFVAASLVNTLGLLPAPLPSWASTAGRVLIVVALAAVGLQTQWAAFRQIRLKPLYLGAVVWGMVACSSLLLQLLAHMR